MHRFSRPAALVLVAVLGACGTETTEPTATDSASTADAVADGATATDSAALDIDATPSNTLCSPCTANADCADGGAGAACVDGGAKGSFCGLACDDATPCPAGYACADGVDVAGKASKQCAPTGGACTCSAAAIASGASTACWVDNGGKKCAGTVTCKADGSLSPCDAKAPSKEVCDNLDNDCDGQVDGDIACDDGQACTKDACDGATKSCTNTAQDGACNDDSPCTADTCDAKAGCQHAPAEGACDDGDACTTGDVCKEGNCAAGQTKDCDDEDGSTVDSCDPNTGLCKNTKKPGCSPSANSCAGRCGEYDGSAACQCDSACKTYQDCCPDIDQVCGANAGCCGDKDCDDDEACTKDTCGSDGACKNEALADDSVCDDGAECTTEKCLGGACAITPKADNTDCGDGNKCIDAGCINGGCAKASKDCDDDDSCTTDLCSAADGACQHAAKALGSACSDGETCTTSDKCDAGGQCVGTAQADGVNCNDGFSCTAKDRCQTGVCVGTPDDTPCDDKNTCTIDLCSVKGAAGTGCLHDPVKDGTLCQDGDKCTVSDACKAGACLGVMKCPTMFTDAFECGNKTGWTFSTSIGGVGWAIDATPNPPGYFSASCSLNYNNGASYPGQTAGTATSKAFKMPAAGGVAISLQTWDSVEGGAGYDKRMVQVSSDGFGSDVTTFQISNAMPKSQWSQFTAKLDKYAGKEVQLRLAFDSVDGVANSGPGWFVDDLRVVIQELPKDLTCTVDHDCPFDGDPCTSQSCKAGKCVAGFSTAPCEDGDLCTDGDTCKDGKCGSGGETNCDDGNVCTDDSCDKVKGCAHANNEGGCADGDACTNPDVCFGGACTATPNTCHDNNPCTVDSCDSKGGQCVHTKVAGCEQKGMKVPWETKFDCATAKAESWDPEGSAQGPKWSIDATPTPPGFKSPQCALNFNDGTNIACPAGTMLSKKIGVEGTAWSPYIDATGVNQGAQLAARFMLAGTWPAAGHLEVEVSVDNGKTWTKLQELKSGNGNDWVLIKLDLAAYVGKFFQLRLHFWTTGCASSGTGPFIDDFKVWDATCKVDKDCEDLNDCTADVCAAATGKCGYTNVKVSTACDDGNACTSDEVCNSAGQCGSGTPKVCDDSNGCTDDVCNPGTGACGYDNKSSGTTCTDANACTEQDKCDSSGNCIGVAKAAGVACSDANSCTEKDSCDGQGQCKGTPLAAGAGSCSDNNACTEQDKCDGGGICAGKAKAAGATCNDSDPCTKDACDANGQCVGAADEAKCDDKDPCTLDTCIKKSTASSSCKHAAVPDGAKCDDGSPCTDSDACTKGFCKGAAICDFSVALSDKFDCGSSDWTLAPAGGGGKVGWQVDGLPDPPAFKSEKCSLNFNNDKDFAGVASGSATSKAITISAGALDASLSVWSYNGVEASAGYDKRFIEISDDAFAKSIQSVQLDNGKSANAWEEVKLPLSQWTGKTVQVRFRFDSVDELNNGTPGWFVDDLVINVGSKK